MGNQSADTSRAVEMLNVMASMQEEHNAQVHPDWRVQRYEYYRAIWVECAEMLDHFGWKWWKKQDADINQVKLELVDIWHFALSELLRSESLTDAVAVELYNLEVPRTTDAEAFRLAIEELAESSLRTKSFELSPFISAMAALPMSYGNLYAMYIGKNVLNQFRQNNGYKTGEYRKLWSGREDNEHLVEILEELGDRLLPEDLYEALEARYRAS